MAEEGFRRACSNIKTLPLAGSHEWLNEATSEGRELYIIFFYLYVYFTPKTAAVGLDLVCSCVYTYRRTHLGLSIYTIGESHRYDAHENGEKKKNFIEKRNRELCISAMD